MESWKSSEQFSEELEALEKKALGSGESRKSLLVDDEENLKLYFAKYAALSERRASKSAHVLSGEQLQEQENTSPNPMDPPPRTFKCNSPAAKALSSKQDRIRRVHRLSVTSPLRPSILHDSPFVPKEESAADPVTRTKMESTPTKRKSGSFEDLVEEAMMSPGSPGKKRRTSLRTFAVTDESPAQVASPRSSLSISSRPSSVTLRPPVALFDTSTADEEQDRISEREDVEETDETDLTATETDYEDDLSQLDSEFEEEEEEDDDEEEDVFLSNQQSTSATEQSTSEDKASPTTKEKRGFLRRTFSKRRLKECCEDLIALDDPRFALLKNLVNDDMATVSILFKELSVGDQDMLAHSLIPLFDNEQASIKLIKWAFSQDLAEESKHKEEMFRGSTTSIRLFREFAKHHGSLYLKWLLVDMIKDLDESGLELELDPLRLNKNLAAGLESNVPSAEEVREDNREKLLNIVRGLLTELLGSPQNCPLSFRQLFKHINEEVCKTLPDRGLTIVSNFFFLRFLNPALQMPHQFNVVPEAVAPNTFRTLVTISKLLQSLSGGEAPTTYLADCNSFVQEYIPQVKQFLEEISLDISCAKGLSQPSPKRNANAVDAKKSHSVSGALSGSRNAREAIPTSLALFLNNDDLMECLYNVHDFISSRWEVVSARLCERGMENKAHELLAIITNFPPRRINAKLHKASHRKEAGGAEGKKDKKRRDSRLFAAMKRKASIGTLSSSSSMGLSQSSDMAVKKRNSIGMRVMRRQSSVTRMINTSKKKLLPIKLGPSYFVAMEGGASSTAVVSPGTLEVANTSPRKFLKGKRRQSYTSATPSPQQTVHMPPSPARPTASASGSRPSQPHTPRSESRSTRPPTPYTAASSSSSAIKTVRQKGTAKSANAVAHPSK
ncbi:Glutamic acid-rich protein [Balamuthia mandrillaris]